MLLVCALLAILLANSSWAPGYFGVWEAPVAIKVGTFELAKPLLLWINDGLMAVFFFVIGLEIKREILVGELTSLKRAAFPMSAALGGMLVPAGVYAAFNLGKPGMIGWGVPMATDIAFALGILALLGSRVPFALKVFLAALAIVDDLGAVLVIALFYTTQIDGTSLLVALAIYGLMWLLNWAGVRRMMAFGLLGTLMWYFVLKGGVHATIAGVLTAFVIPAQARVDSAKFVARAKNLVTEFAQSGSSGKTELLNETQDSVLHALEMDIEHVSTPLQRMLHAFHPWSTYAIMPVFALANAGVAVSGSQLETALTDPVTHGVTFGLLVGKPVGILLFTLLAVKLGLAALPRGVTWRMVAATGMLAGIGFTMSLFITSLAFENAPTLAGDAKIGVLSGSLIAGLIGYFWLKSSVRGRRAAD